MDAQWFRDGVTSCIMKDATYTIRARLETEDYPDIQLSEGMLNLNNAPEMNQDLHDFIARVVTELTITRPSYAPLAGFIIGKLQARASGMYRLVELLIERLDNLTNSTVAALEESLQEVPGTIAEIHDII
jgi:hypothetical protein